VARIADSLSANRGSSPRGGTEMTDLLGKRKSSLKKMEHVFPNGQHRAPFVYVRNKDEKSFDKSERIHFCVYCANCGAGLCDSVIVALNTEVHPAECNVVVQPCQNCVVEVLR
jgi:hypothetical protein